MNKGIEILLERMKSNPEEFFEKEMEVSKWMVLVREYDDLLEPEDLQAFYGARKALLQEQFTKEVMEELLDPKEQGVLAKLLHTKQQGATQLGGATPSPYSSSLLDAQKYQMEQMKAHLEAHRLAIQTQEQKKHQTLYGKLKNYLHDDK